MKGIIFDVVAEIVISKHGEDAWDSILVAAGSDGVYTALGSYPDSDLMALVAASGDALNLTPDQTLVVLGQHAFGVFSQRYPELLTGIDSLRTCLSSLNTIIHPEVLKLYPSATPPDFELTDLPNGDLRLRYISRRHLCRLAEGLVLGAADHFGEDVVLLHESCRDRGDEQCTLKVNWTADGPDE